MAVAMTIGVPRSPFASGPNPAKPDASKLARLAKRDGSSGDQPLEALYSLFPSVESQSSCGSQPAEIERSRQGKHGDSRTGLGVSCVCVHRHLDDAKEREFAKSPSLSRSCNLGNPSESERLLSVVNGSKDPNSICEVQMMNLIGKGNG